MKRYFFKLTMYLIVIGGFANYLVYFTTGKVPLSSMWKSTQNLAEQLPTPSMATLSTPPMPKIPGVNDSAPRAFKWTDSNGVIHYSDQAPDGEDAKIIAIEANIEAQPQSNSAGTDNRSSKKIVVGGNEVDLDAIKKQLQDAQQSRNGMLNQ
jgi:hypothetical protein